MPQDEFKSDTVKSRGPRSVGPWFWCAMIAAVVGVTWLYADVFRWLLHMWGSNDDYSHGYFVPLFSAYVLWSNREKLHLRNPSPTLASDLAVGITLLLAGLALRVAGIYLRVLTFEALSLIPFLVGAVVILTGRELLRWFVPAALFLVFMIPLPQFLSGQMSGLLQTLATGVSTFALQTLGVPAVAEGNIISLSTGTIGVAEACSGLRMLYAFFALTLGACLVIDRSLIEKVFIAASAVPIAIAANCIRIVATGLAYEYFDPHTAEYIFHDVAGWLMMPLGFLILMLGLSVLDRMLVIEDAPLTARA